MWMDLLQILLPALILLVGVIVIVRGFLKNQTESMTAFLLKEAEYRKIESERRTLEISKANKEITMPLRLHAYERMTLFCTRLELSNVVKRSNVYIQDAKSLSRDLLHNIEEEYAHNISQQMYMTDELWQIIQLATVEATGIIKKAMQLTQEQEKEGVIASASLFIDVLAAFLNENPQLGYIQALSAIKKEVALLY
jgi:hypothetical protein